MENSSKALLIAAGLLLAIMIVSLLVISYNQWSNYQQSKQSSMTEEQIVVFNKEYEAYNRDNVTGFELVSLINKIISFNSNNAVDGALGFNNTDKAYTKMYVKFSVTKIYDDETSKSKSDKQYERVFKSKEYDSEYSKTNTELESIINEMRGYENTYGATTMSKLASLTDYDPNDTSEIKRVLGEKDSDTLGALPTKTQVKRYQTYIDFKRANFKCVKTEYDNQTGRITKLIFEQK